MSDAIEQTMNNALNRRLSRREFVGRAAFNARDPYMRRFWWIEKIVKPLQQQYRCFSSGYLDSLQVMVGWWELERINPGTIARRDQRRKQARALGLRPHELESSSPYDPV